MFKAWPKIPRLVNDTYTLTEKLDGTNSCIIKAPIDLSTPLDQASWMDGDYALFAQSRKRIITPQDDNFGFANWVNKHGEELVEILPESYTYGEWWGNGIQRGYGVTKRYFSAFNPFFKDTSGLINTVPLIAEGVDFLDLQNEIDKAVDDFKVFGSSAPSSVDHTHFFGRAEGIIVYSNLNKVSWKVILDK